MPGFFGVIGKKTNRVNNFVINSINLTGKHLNKSFSDSNYFFNVSYKKSNPLKGKRFFENKNYISLFHGDLIGYKYIDWNYFIKNISNNNIDIFRKLNGIYSMLFYNKKTNETTLISDRRGQDPLYYYCKNNSFIFSTDLSTFCRIIDVEFNEKWLYEYFFFNAPVTNRTPVKNICRVGYSEILTFSKSGLSKSKYSKIFKANDYLLEGHQSLKYASEVFNKRVPEYYGGCKINGCALTSGWDSRTNLVYAPKLNNILAYTYGIPGCQDLIKASEFAKKIKVKHERILLDENFVNKIPDYMIKSVWLSSGLNNIGRCSLYYTYKLLNENFNINNIVSGIFLDALFRGHLQPMFKNIIYFQQISNNIKKEEFLRNYHFKNCDLFYNTINDSYQLLQYKYGDINSNETQLIFHLYVEACNYFAGEIKIADNFTNLRVPAWDISIIRLALNIKESTLSFSLFSDHKKHSWPEMLMQSYLLNKKNKAFASFPVRNRSPKWVIRGKIPYLLNRYFNALVSKINNTNNRGIDLEDNNKWLREDHKLFIEDIILSGDSYINKYFDQLFIKKTFISGDKNHLIKLITAEILIRLIYNKWKHNIV